MATGWSRLPDPGFRSDRFGRGLHLGRYVSRRNDQGSKHAGPVCLGDVTLYTVRFRAAAAFRTPRRAPFGGPSVAAAAAAFGAHSAPTSTPAVAFSVFPALDPVDGDNRDRLANEFFYRRDVLAIFRCREGKSAALAARPAGPPDPVT